MPRERTDPPLSPPIERPPCNIVMKGGITSGVVYPLTVVELSKKYRFAGIGGTSAGAIAASLTAAAELGRASGGFDKLSAVAADLPKIMRSLFQPSPRYRRLFELLMGLAPERSAWRKAVRVVAGSSVAYPVPFALGILPALVLVAAGWLLRSPALAFVAAPLALALFLPLALALRVHRFLTRELPRSDFGLCPGVRQPWAMSDGLIDWLADLLDDVAGLPRGVDGRPVKPLTFGDLNGPDPAHPVIDLQMFTTCLSTGRPHVMPTDLNVFLFDPAEMRALFPERIVRWMVDHSKSFEGDPRLRYLPSREHLPVVVPVRMSLSFPFLFPTVPLWMRDRTLTDPAQQAKPRRLRFADGGMCSNLPLQLFDHLWPLCPTFAVALDPFSPDRHRAADGTDVRVKLQSRSRAGILLPVVPIDTLGAFIGSMLGTMQNWQDHLQATLPGYRERMIRVRLKDDEGGMNLDMDPVVIAHLGDLGRQAGIALATEFDWPAHRWIRAISALDRLSGALTALDADTIAFIRARNALSPPNAQTKAWQTGAVAAMDALVAWRAANTASLAPPKPPRPLPQMRMMPRP
ncbi:MAG: hypothetical protein ABI780_06685 [Ardenticatenales bacterium]